MFKNIKLFQNTIFIIIIYLIFTLNLESQITENTINIEPHVGLKFHLFDNIVGYKHTFYGDIKNIDSLECLEFKKTNIQVKNNSTFCLLKIKNLKWVGDYYYEIIDTINVRSDRVKFFSFKEEIIGNKVKLKAICEKKILKTWVFNKREFNIDGLWRMSCSNTLTTFDINKTFGYLSLYYGAIYINISIEKNKLKENEYFIKYSSIASQRVDYENAKSIKESEISKSEIIGKLIKNKKNLILNWYGLYNTKTKQREFVNDAVFIIENDDNSNIIFKKCE
ncbi:MAG: hypothetical protein ACOYLP_09420 [Flavobacterium sp.]|uniref:hypothetical protein n=1 Tax=Flavobacterium sp. TaxID=239 RepID=UPI003BD229C3